MYLPEQCHLCLPPFERLARTSHSVPHPLNPPTLIPSLRLPRLPLFYQFVLTLVPVLSVWLHTLQLLSINPLPPQLALVPELIPLTKTPPRCPQPPRTRTWVTRAVHSRPPEPEIRVFPPFASTTQMSTSTSNSRPSRPFLGVRPPSQMV